MSSNTNIKSTPKDVFLHLLNIFTFYLSVISFITLYIQYISALFPDPLDFYFTSMANSVRLSTSILVIAIPVYILTSWLLGKDLASKPERRELKLRKWLTYFTLFISAVTIIVDLIMFVFSFLSGELTVQFFLKVFVVLLVAGAVFGYYVWDLRRKEMKSKTPKILAWALSFVVLASIIGGFFIIGTPAEQRDRRFDEERVGDLQILQSQIINYWMQKEVLPAKLDDLQDSISGFVPPSDPATDLPYEYYVIGDLSFELCATFKTSSYESSRQNWEYNAERTCFERTIDPDFYNEANRLYKEPLPIRD